MSIKMTIIRRATQWLIGAQVFKKIEQVVVDLMDMKLSGEDKKEMALSELRDLKVSISKALINLAIEVAVSYFKLNRK